MMARLGAALRRPWVQRGLTALLLGIVIVILVRQSRNIDWSEVMRSLRNYDRSTLAIALSLSALSYAVYACFDLLARRYLRRKPSALRMVEIAFISYGFNQSLGSLLGTIAFRLRLYSRLGLKAAEISRIIALSVLTNWLGYAVLAGVVFTIGWVALPADWQVGSQALRWVGVLFLGAATGYLLLSVFRGDRDLVFRKHRFTMPNMSSVLLQLGLSIAHWPLASASLYVLLGGQIEYFSVLGTMFLSAIAVVVTHVPAGVGVLEAVFIGAFRDRMPVTEILAALLAYRVIHFLVPLMVAAAMYVRAELRGKETAPLAAPSTQRR